MIRHAAPSAPPIGPLPVAVIEPSVPALLVPPVGVPPLLPPRFPPASLAAVLMAPVTMTADPEHRATAGAPAKPLPQGLFAGPHPRPSGGTGEPRLGLARSTPSADALFTLRGAERAPLLSGEHGRIRHGAQTGRLGSHRGSHLSSGRAGERTPRSLAPGAAPLHPSRSGEPTGRCQRSGPRFGLHGTPDGAVLPAPHQPRQPAISTSAQRPLHLGHECGCQLNKLPFGNLPRLLLAWVCTEAVRTQSRELVLGASLADFMRKLDIYSTSGGTTGGRTRLRNQMDRLFNASVSLIYEDAHNKQFISSHIADRGEFWWNPRRPDERMLWESKIRLGEDFFKEINRHSVPLDMNILKALKRSSLGLDWYLWLTYRTFSLKRPLRLSWRQLYHQFGADPSKADDKFILRNFRRDCLRELKKIKVAWPDLNYAMAKGVLILYPSKPTIPPTRLQLVE